MTPLQQAAQSVIDRWDSPTWRDQPHTAGYVADLRLALADEQAQAVEPVADDIVAGALYDFLGYLTSRRTRVTMSERDDAGAAVDALFDWSKTRKINLTEARVLDWNDYTHPAPPPVMHLSEILAEKGITLRTEFGPNLRDTAPPATGERAEFEAWASHPGRHGKLPVDAHPNGAYKDTRTYTAYYAWAAAKKTQAQQVAVPYDQQALELCPECGWKAIMPGEPCLLCSKDAQQVAVPAGMALVPIEPTGEMIVALMCTGLRHAEYKRGCDPTIAHMAQGYTAMLAAAQGVKLVTKPDSRPTNGGAA